MPKGNIRPELKRVYSEKAGAIKINNGMIYVEGKQQDVKTSRAWLNGIFTAPSLMNPDFYEAKIVSARLIVRAIGLLRPQVLLLSHME